MTISTLQEARAALASGDPGLALSLARTLSSEERSDVDLLEVAVAAAIEVADDRAVALSRQLLQRQPSAMAHRSLGFALMVEGEMDEAAESFRCALELDPNDTAAAVSLGHLSRMRGRDREATQLLERAAAEDTTDPGVLSNLVDLHWMAGRLRKAITWAERLVELTPQDPLALLDLAELSMELNEHDVAVDVFGRIRQADQEPGHRIFPLHGMVEAHIRAGQLRCALDLAVTATEVDREELTTDALAHIVDEVFGRATRPGPSREQLLARFAAERARYRNVLNGAGVM